MLDKKIMGGTIVDGTGRPGFPGNIGTKNGRIVAIGCIEETARETIDATDRVVAPGFIDVHTHYDAQAFWDPTFGPSSYHGVTTIVGGLCGFSIAPLTPEAAPYLQRMLARVEGMPLKTLQDAVPWNWSSFGDFLSKLEGKIGVNAGFFAGHSAIRRVVMGERAVGEKATPEEIEQMKNLLDVSLAEDALGFSSTVSPAHSDGEGNPVPSRWADKSEFMELARVVSRHEGTGLEMAPDIGFKPGAAELLAEISIAGQRAVNWNLLYVDGRPDIEKIVERQLNVSNYAREHGGEVIALTVPAAISTYLSLRTGVIFDTFPGIWKELFTLSPDQRIRTFKDVAVRKQMTRDVAKIPSSAFNVRSSQLSNYLIVSVHAEENKRYEGRKVSDVMAEENREALDVILDIAIADNLETIFSPNIGGDDQVSYELRGRLWADDRTLIGGSDAGAHLDMIDTFGFSTDLLQKGVREHKVISLEQAVHRITQRAATYYGLIDRGQIKEGFYGDLVVFDPDTVSRCPTYQRFDMPGAGDDFRLYAEARGIDHVFVNGIEIVRNGKHTQNLPGMVLRSGKDTRTVALDGMRKAP